jgi:hypothetical protein
MPTTDKEVVDMYRGGDTEAATLTLLIPHKKGAKKYYSSKIAIISVKRSSR